nr:MAG: hypothetical protein DIU52_00265 [bacterium]
MDRRPLSRLDPDLRRRLEVAAEVTRAKLVDVHFAHVLELIERARADNLPAGRALEIYARLHHLRDEDAEQLAKRVLAHVGGRAIRLAALGRGDERLSDVFEDDDVFSVFRQLRRRLRGRRNHELRRWVELHTARTELALLDVHADGAARFIELVKPESSLGDAVRLYARVMQVRDSIVEALYLLALDRHMGGGARLCRHRRAAAGRGQPLRPRDAGNPHNPAIRGRATGGGR